MEKKKKKKENKETEGIAPDTTYARVRRLRGGKKKRRIKEKYTIHVYDLRVDSLLFRNREKESLTGGQRKYRRLSLSADNCGGRF